MFDDLNDRGNLVQLDEGAFIERDVLNIIEQIQHYDPNLKVQYLEQAANLGDAPWRVVERCRDGQWRTVFYVWHMDQRVLDRLLAADTGRLDVLGRLEATNQNARRAEQQRYEDKKLEEQDIVKHILASPKHKYSFNQDGRWIQIDDSAPHKVIEKDT